jgi:uncharacterized protein (TIGR02001 family)
MRNLRILGALVLTTTAGVANAELSSTWTLASDYDFRGISQSATDPALQGSIDFATDNGWYVGAWASNVDFPAVLDENDAVLFEEVNYEVDLYTGFSGGDEEGLGWDVGIVYYMYPDESDYNFPEIYGGATYNWFEGKLWYSNDFGGSEEDAWYVEGNGTFPIGESGFSVLAHLGYSYGDYWDSLTEGTDLDGEYMDYSVGVGYDVSNFSLALKYVDTDGDLETTDDPFNNEGRVIFTISTTFPWGEG